MFTPRLHFWWVTPSQTEQGGSASEKTILVNRRTSLHLGPHTVLAKTVSGPPYSLRLPTNSPSILLFSYRCQNCFQVWGFPCLCLPVFPLSPMDIFHNESVTRNSVVESASRRTQADTLRERWGGYEPRQSVLYFTRNSQNSEGLLKVTDIWWSGMKWFPGNNGIPWVVLISCSKRHCS